MTDCEQSIPPSILFDATEHLNCPYVVGNIIKLQLKTPFDGQTMDARIIKVFEPFTCSCVMVIRPVCPLPAWEGDMVLKIFDRRFATEPRKEDEIIPWTLDIEQSYHQFILNGDAAKLITELTTNRDVLDRDSHTWNSSQEETYLHDYMQVLHERETQAYDTMTDMQGETIPRLLSCVTMPISTPVQNNPLSKYIDIPGLLLQYIEGFPLTDIATCAPPDRWQSICEEAIRIINLVGERGILNKDVKTRNFVVQNCAENQFRVFMVDFGLCDFREEFTDEIDWETCKATQDEEGAVGYVMQKKLQGGFIYHRSPLYRKLDKKYKTPAVG